VKSTDWVKLAARIGLGLPFVTFGLFKFLHANTMASYIAAHGLPGWLVWPAAVFQLVAGIMVMSGVGTRAAAAALAVFCVVATSIFHSNFSDLRELSDFTKDLAATGGFLLLALSGPGALSLDSRASPPTHAIE
jgi:putative oxidoreductase